LAGGGVFDLDADLNFVFGTGFAQNDDGAERFVIDPSDKIGFAGAVLLPKLANLDLPRAHSDALNVERLARSVNCPDGRQYTVRWHHPGGETEKQIPPLRGPTRQTAARKSESGRCGRDDKLE